MVGIAKQSTASRPADELESWACMITTLQSYLCPGIGGATNLLLNEQWPTPSLVLTTPHCTGSTAALISSAGGWQAALMAPLHVPASGIPIGYLLKPVAIVVRTMTTPICRKNRSQHFGTRVVVALKGICRSDSWTI